MDYQKIYNQIVERGKLRTNIEGYSEKHHIVPRCMGGTDEKSNLTLLTAREHFICHWLLVRIYPTNHKLVHAFWFMCNVKGRGQEERYSPSSRTYQESKILRTVVGHSLESRNKMSGKPRTEETKRRISIKNTGRVVSQETRDKMSSIRKGRLVSEEFKKKIGDLHRGSKRSEETKQKMRKPKSNTEKMKGRIVSEETRMLMRKARLGKTFKKQKDEKIRQ